MPLLALLVACLAFLLALLALQRGSRAQERVERLEADLARRVAGRSLELQSSIETLRELLAALAAGASLSPEQIREGRLWRDIDGAEGRRLLEQQGARLLDVRSPEETRAGILPGAMLVPVDQLEDRLSELPRDGRPTIVYCAMGARSASACEFLTSEGFVNLHNLEGGVGAWGGPLERPAAG